MHDSPTPPHPMTATVAPGSTAAVWITAPTPVVTPQPISAARSSGMSSRIFAMACSCRSMYSANEERFRNWAIDSPPLLSRGGSSPPRCSSGSWHSDMWPVRQNSQCPQNADRQVMTWSPGLT